MWGKNELGEHKKALVACKDIAIDKAHGGVGFDNLSSTSLVLKMWWLGQLLTEFDTMWVFLAKEGIARSLNSGFRRRTKCFWIEVEAILLDKNLHIMGSPFFRDLIRGFNLARSKLYFIASADVLPRSLTIEQ